MKQFGEVVCTKAGTYEGKTFKIGDIYPILGWNNGHRLVYEDKKGDVKEMILLDIDFTLQEPNTEIEFSGVTNFIDKVKNFFKRFKCARF